MFQKREWQCRGHRVLMLGRAGVWPAVPRLRHLQNPAPAACSQHSPGGSWMLVLLSGVFLQWQNMHVIKIQAVHECVAAVGSHLPTLP